MTVMMPVLVAPLVPMAMQFVTVAVPVFVTVIMTATVATNADDEVVAPVFGGSWCGSTTEAQRQGSSSCESNHGISKHELSFQ